MQNCDESFIQVTIWVDILFKYDVDILNIDRINKDLKIFENYSLVLKNLILNRDDLYGVSPERETVEG